MRKIWAGLLFFFGILGAGGAFARGDNLKSDEFVLLLPGFAVEQADGSFNVGINAWVFEQESRRLVMSALASWAGIDFDELPLAQKALFVERTRFFRTDSERGKRLQVRVADQVFAPLSTDASGRARGELGVGREWVKWQGAPGGTGWIDWALEVPGHALHGVQSRAWIVPAEGVSIVSDIDDTIKISEVRDRKKLIRNTFVEPFRVVPGMAEWYREIARDQQQPFFHYLSAAPIQLYPVLSEFLEEGRFPPGSLHLRESTSWRTLYAGHDTTIAHKKRVLTYLLATWPRRRFILIGDSGEKDPEIYADIARSHPGRILAIHIRNVTSEDRAAPRYQQTFAGIDPKIWHIRD